MIYGSFVPAPPLPEPPLPLAAMIVNCPGVVASRVIFVPALSWRAFTRSAVGEPDVRNELLMSGIPSAYAALPALVAYNALPEHEADVPDEPDHSALPALVAYRADPEQDADVPADPDHKALPELVA